MKVITCKEAKEKGLSRYFTGKPCKHGHIDERRTHNRECCGCIKAYTKKRYNKHKDRILEENKEWRLANRDKLAEYRRTKRNNDPLEKLRNSLHNHIVKLLNGEVKSESSYDLLRYNVVDLRDHLESLWEPWMNWDNYGLGEGCWVIDHIKPVKAFFDEGITDIEVINSLDNLQPLCWRENMIKGCKYDEEQE